MHLYNFCELLINDVTHLHEVLGKGVCDYDSTGLCCNGRSKKICVTSLLNVPSLIYIFTIATSPKVTDALEANEADEPG